MPRRRDEGCGGGVPVHHQRDVNRLCAGLGFDDLGEVELDVAGQRFTCTRWRLEPPYLRDAVGLRP